MGLADNRIPPEKLPPCWSDDVRMNALFAPFRLKTANPESWEMKMKFWSEMLRVWCRHRSDPIVSAADAKVAFQREGRTPACLEIVIEELYRNGSLAPINKYQQILHNGPEGWIGWGARLAFRPAVFALTAVSSLLPGKQAVDGDGLPKASIDATQRFVLESAVEEQATDFLNNFPAECPRLGTVDELMQSSGHRGRETFELLLGWLVSRGHAVKKGEVVKLAASTSTRAAPVSEADAALVRLLSAERRLERDATRLSRDVAQATSDARASLQLGNKLAAKNHLRRKHKLSERAAKCESALDNVRQLVLSMQEMDVNKEVVDTYKMTSQAMKRGLKEGGIDEDSVHDTMDDLKEVLDTYSEVEKALSSTVDDFDAAELEDELKELLAAPPPAGGGTPGKGERRQAPLKLPSPPARLPEDFVYDGEARVLAELSELSAGDSPRQSGTHKPSVNRTRTAVADVWQEEKESEKPSQPWYPRNEEFGASRADDLSQEFAELHMDDRLHPGQKLDIDHRSPTKHCVSDFEVNDHRLQDGVWLFNSRQNEGGDLRTNIGGTDYNSADSPGRALFQMAPGGERRGPASPWQPDQADRTDSTDRTDPTDHLQRRLDELRKL